jgi:hypothetical protein
MSEGEQSAIKIAIRPEEGTLHFVTTLPSQVHLLPTKPDLNTHSKKEQANESSLLDHLPTSTVSRILGVLPDLAKASYKALFLLTRAAEPQYP